MAVKQQAPNTEALLTQIDVLRGALLIARNYVKAKSASEYGARDLARVDAALASASGTLPDNAEAK